MQQLRVRESHLIATAAIPGQWKDFEIELLQARDVDLAELSGLELWIHPPVVLQLVAVAEFREFSIFAGD